MKKVLFGLLMAWFVFESSVGFAVIRKMSNSDVTVIEAATNSTAYAGDSYIEISYNGLSVPTGSTGVRIGSFYNAAKNAKLDYKTSAVSSGTLTATVSWRRPESESTELATETLTSGTDIVDFDSSIFYLTFTTSATTANPTVTGNAIYILQ